MATTADEAQRLIDAYLKKNKNTNTLTGDQKDAFVLLQDTLKQYGLESLTKFVFDAITGSKSEAEILRDIRKTPEFAKRFPAIVEREKKGLSPLSPAEYVSYERSAAQLMRSAGLPKGFYDGNDDFTKFLTNDVSLSELQNRVQLGQQAAYEAAPEVRDALKKQYGITDGDLTAYFLDPTRAEPLLKQRWTAAQINGAAQIAGFGMGTTDEVERLAKMGVTADQAAQGYGQLVASKELYGALPGEAGANITRAEQVGAALGGDAQAKARIARRQQSRTAVFDGGGSVATGNTGVSGLADTRSR